jgi:hypothetical protein
VPVILPVHPEPGQSSEELAWPLDELPGIGVPWALVIPLLVPTVAVASLPTWQPLWLAVQRALVCPVAGELCGAPAVSLRLPVVVALQPGPAHAAEAWETVMLAGALRTGSAAVFAAAVAVVSAWVAVLAAFVAAVSAALIFAAVAPGWALTARAWAAALVAA